MSRAAAVMPNLAAGTHAFHHTLDSAVATLSAMNVPAARITIEMSGPGHPSLWVTGQTPDPGVPLTAGTAITLQAAGTDFLHSLPVGMWDRGDASEPGTAEVLAPVDDALQKAALWVRDGARLFDIQPDHFEDCARWISLFGINPELWPREKWYSLAILLHRLQALAATEQGVRVGLYLLLDLPLKEIRRHSPSFSYIGRDSWTLFGNSFSRLGLDFVVGDRAEETAELVLILGPVALEIFYSFRNRDRARLLASALDLLMPLHQKYSVQWLVLDPARAPRLGCEECNARLGVNSHLGPERACSGVI